MSEYPAAEMNAVPATTMRKLGLRSRFHHPPAVLSTTAGAAGNDWRTPTTSSTSGASTTLTAPMITNAVRQPRLWASRPPPSRLAVLASGMAMVITASGAERRCGTKLRAT